MSTACGFPFFVSLRQAVSSASDFDEDAFEKAHDALEAEMPQAFGSYLGGHPALIQSDMELECQLVSNGLYCGDSSGWHSPAVQTLAPGAADWRLLLQLDEEFLEDGVVWGDSGCVYFWCRHQDMAAGRFDRGWTVLQCS
jgi:uncharacterized protein YwqG